MFPCVRSVNFGEFLEVNPVRNLLLKLKICDEASIVPYHTVRDNENIPVLRCNKSGVIFLDNSDHIDSTYYENTSIDSYWNKSRKEAQIETFEDNKRRCDFLRPIVSEKKWLDVGTGAGGLLDMLSPYSTTTIAVEPQNEMRTNLIKDGYDTHASIEDVSHDDIDVISLFHVFEHIPSPIDFLSQLKNKLKPGGKVVIEVPHANDFLFSFLDSKEFKDVAFWSEHLILHTMDSLRIFLETAGFKNIIVKGIQRYPLANHLHWLKEKRPNGHVKWAELRTENLDLEYGNLLTSINMTDTLLATAINYD